MNQDYSLGPCYGAPDYPLLRHVVEDLRPEGYALEFGVGSGASLVIIAEHMPVIGFDSFEGLPEPWFCYPKGSFAPDHPDTGWGGGLPIIMNSRLVTGWFADTLPTFDFPDPIGLIHIDCDLYSSTKTILEHVPLQPGCYVVFDEYWGPIGVELDEGRAWHEFADKTGIEWTVIGNSKPNMSWAIEIQ